MYKNTTDLIRAMEIMNKQDIKEELQWRKNV